MPSKEHPLYVYVMGNQKAYLHEGNASNPKEALEQLHHIADEATPVAILEVTHCKMFKLSEVAGPFCPACGAVDIDDEPDNCFCAR